MITVTLNGPLAEFGRTWQLDVQTPAEAIRAIGNFRKGFVEKVLSLGDGGLVFLVQAGDVDHDEHTLHMPITGDALEITPVMQTSSAGVRFVVGAILVATSFYVDTVFPGFGEPMRMAGVSLMLGSIVEWLTPVKKSSDEDNRVTSWGFSGGEATVEVGSAIPVIYGEVLAPAVPISAGIVALDVSIHGLADPFATLGGERDIHTVLDAGSSTKVVRGYFTIAHSNYQAGSTTAWRFTGFDGADPRVVSRTNTNLTMEFTVSQAGAVGDIYAEVSGNSLKDGTLFKLVEVARVKLTADYPSSYYNDSGPMGGESGTGGGGESSGGDSVGGEGE